MFRLTNLCFSSNMIDQKINDLWPTIEQFNSAEFQAMRVWSEHIHMYKMKHFGYSSENIPRHRDLPIHWLSFEDTFPTSHPLNRDTFGILLLRRNHTLPQLQKLSYRWWKVVDDNFDELTISTLLLRMFTADELVYALSRH